MGVSCSSRSGSWVAVVERKREIWMIESEKARKRKWDCGVAMEMDKGQNKSTQVLDMVPLNSLLWKIWIQLAQLVSLWKKKTQAFYFVVGEKVLL